MDLSAWLFSFLDVVLRGYMFTLLVLCWRLFLASAAYSDAKLALSAFTTLLPHSLGIACVLRLVMESIVPRHPDLLFKSATLRPHLGCTKYSTLTGRVMFRVFGKQRYYHICRFWHLLSSDYADFRSGTMKKVPL